jgi:diguanylate cyclase (GGDEF)-like protein
MGRIMEKDDLKSLVTQMYKELLKNIDSQQEANKEQIISYLEDAINTIKTIKDTEIDSIEHAKLAFTNAYKEIAKESISSYQQTNGKFEALSKRHQTTIEEAKDYLIDIPAITEQFDDIQMHMTQEIQKANTIIAQLSEQIKELEEDSNLDGLTKVFNRRALDRYLENVTKKGTLQHDLYLLILDIDDFKNINDTYGHIVGDKILIFISNLLRKTLRDGDKVFRYGGEEFVVILNRITKEKCEEIAKRILHTVRTNTLFYKGKSVKVTMSIGVTKYLSGDTSETLIERADKALYRSKERGKNQLNMEFKNGH